MHCWCATRSAIAVFLLGATSTISIQFPTEDALVETLSSEEIAGAVPARFPGNAGIADGLCRGGPCDPRPFQ